MYMKLFDLKSEALTSNANQLIGAMSGVFQVRVIWAILESCIDNDRLVLSSES